MKKISFIIIALAMLVAISGVVMADTGVPAVPEKQLITTTTIANVDGLVMETDATAMTLTNNPTVLHQLTTATGVNLGVLAGINIGAAGAQAEVNALLAQVTALGGTFTWHLAGPGAVLPALPGDVIIDSLSLPDAAMGAAMVDPAGFIPDGMTWGTVYALAMTQPGVQQQDVTQGIHTGMLSANQVQYSTTYDLAIVAQNGATSMQKTNAINTNNMLTGQKNLDMPLAITFIATDDGGNMHGVENIMLDGAARAQTTSAIMLCPFAPSVVGPVVPPFCNIIQAGGAWDLTVGSVTTAADEKFIGTDATSPVTLNYEINVKPYGTSAGQIPAMGSASAYYKAHIQEGRTASNTVSEDLTSSESSSVNGMITGFYKKISYVSGPKLPQ